MKIFLKNQARPEDKELNEQKLRTHNIIMETDNKNENKLEYSTFETVLTRLKLKDKKMYKHITKAGEKFQKAMFKYYEPLVNNEQVPETYNYTKLFGLWKGKGSELDLNMMQYIHGKDQEAKMLEALVAECMKPKIHAAIPDIQIGGKAGHSSIEHLITIKTWMLNMEVEYSRVSTWKNSLTKSH